MGECSSRSQEESQLSILVMEDDNKERNHYCTLFSRRGYRPIEADSGEKALQIYHASDVLWADIRLPGRDGYEIAREIQQQDKSKSIFFVSAYPDLIKKVEEEGIKYEMAMTKPILGHQYQEIYARLNALSEKNEECWIT